MVSGGSLPPLLAATNCSSLECLRAAPANTLWSGIEGYLNNISSIGTRIGFPPVLGGYIAELPSVRFATTSRAGSLPTLMTSVVGFHYPESAFAADSIIIDGRGYNVSFQSPGLFTTLTLRVSFTTGLLGTTPSLYEGDTFITDTSGSPSSSKPSNQKLTHLQALSAGITTTT